MTLKLAMWSGPRNLSTAMMRAWENRPDTTVWDEPLYAYYLAATGLDHPGREAILRAGDTDWRRATTACCGPAPNGRPVFFQKHMSHHLLAEVDHDWTTELQHFFLIRDPAAVLRSYTQTRYSVTLEDIGLPQQLALYRHLCAAEPVTPLVIDADDFLRHPRAYLQALCVRFDLPFSERMLSWPAGQRDSDGVWGQYWYASVWRSTGFTAPREKPPAAALDSIMPPALRALAEAAQPYYTALYQMRLRPTDLSIGTDHDNDNDNDNDND